jgi:hypothetical protein
MFYGRMELGAPSKPSRGTGDFLALVLVLVPLGLILMLVHPALAIAIWALTGCLGPGVIEPDESRPCGDPGRRWRSRAPLAPPTAPGREDREGGGQLLRRGGLQCRHSQPGPNHSVRVEAD